jgi:hypothetical protein
MTCSLPSNSFAVSRQALARASVVLLFVGLLSVVVGCSDTAANGTLNPNLPATPPLERVATSGQPFTWYSTSGGGIRNAVFSDLRFGRHDGFDRAVVAFDGWTPSWRASITPSGIKLVLDSLSEDLSLDDPCDGGTSPALAIESCYFSNIYWRASQGTLVLNFELDRDAPYRVDELDGRLVIDVAADGAVGARSEPAEAVNQYLAAWEERETATMAAIARPGVRFDAVPVAEHIMYDDPNCFGEPPTATCEGIWVFEDHLDHATTIAYIDVSLVQNGGAWWITSLTCDPMYEC